MALGQRHREPGVEGVAGSRCVGHGHRERPEVEALARARHQAAPVSQRHHDRTASPLAQGRSGGHDIRSPGEPGRLAGIRRQIVDGRPGLERRWWDRRGIENGRRPSTARLLQCPANCRERAFELAHDHLSPPEVLGARLHHLDREGAVGARSHRDLVAARDINDDQGRCLRRRARRGWRGPTRPRPRSR